MRKISGMFLWMMSLGFTSFCFAEEVSIPLSVGEPFSKPGNGPERSGPVEEATSTSLEAGTVRTIAVTGTSLQIEMVYCPPGEFRMGSLRSPDQLDRRDGSERAWFEAEHPRRRVVLARGFWIGKTEVTQPLYESLMGDNPSEWKGRNLPVDTVTWQQCQRFIRILNRLVPGGGFRLPSEAEWEYACRAGSETEFSFGDSWEPLGEYAWYLENSGSRTHPVGTRLPNAWGLHDMHGNLWEWCQDTFQRSYTGAPDDGSAWEVNSIHLRVIRGGSWNNHPNLCRSAFRFGNEARFPSRSYGFRLVRDAEEIPR